MNRKHNINILHITPHLGGGVGRVLLNYLSKVKDNNGYTHDVICLDYANYNAVETAESINLKLSDKMSDNPQLLNAIAEADVVLIHWWNHPLLYDLMVRLELPPCRLIIWSHISGFNAPYVFTNKIIEYPDMFVFATPVSFEAREIQSLSVKQKESLRVVWSTGGVDHICSVLPKKHAGFNIGYIGTVDYCKMHPDFLDICSRIDIPNVKFTVCGGSKEKEVQHEATQRGLSNKIKFTGLVSNINPYLAEFDIFGYPLAPYHFGSCDQVLAESMAAGVVPVVLSNRMESHMIKDGVTGIVAKNQKEYIEGIKKLYVDSQLRSNLSKNAKEYAYKTFTLSSIEREWTEVFERIMAFPKAVKRWDINLPRTEISAKDVFLESLGQYGAPFKNYSSASNEDERDDAVKNISKLNESPLWQSETRGTVHHYKTFFPNDNYLSTWSRLMNEK